MAKWCWRWGEGMAVGMAGQLLDRAERVFGG